MCLTFPRQFISWDWKMLPTTKLKVNLKLVSGTDLCLRRVNRMSQFSLKSQDFLFSGVDKNVLSPRVLAIGVLIAADSRTLRSPFYLGPK